MPESQVTKSMERYRHATARDKNPAVALSKAMRAQDDLEAATDGLFYQKLRWLSSLTS
jgi:hypothetical protein